MFDSKTDTTERLADTIDLVIDFATLGEYGLEPVGRLAEPCEGRRGGGWQRSTGTWASAIDRFATSCS